MDAGHRPRELVWMLFFQLQNLVQYGKKYTPVDPVEAGTPAAFPPRPVRLVCKNKMEGAVNPTGMSAGTRNRGWFQSWNRLNHYLDLVFFRAWGDLRAEAHRYYLSYIWWVLGPVLEMTVYYLVFGLGLRAVRTEHFMVFLLIGIIIWRWFDATVSHCTNAVRGGRSLMQQVDLPKIVFPLIVICTDTFKFLIAFSLIVMYINIYGLLASSAYLILPVVLTIQLMFIMAVGILFSCITPFLPDFAVFVNYPIRIMFFMSGIFYDIDKIPEQYRFLFVYNPMARLIHTYRSILLHGQFPDIELLLTIASLSFLGVLAAGALLFRLDKVIPRALAR